MASSIFGHDASYHACSQNVRPWQLRANRQKQGQVLHSYSALFRLPQPPTHRYFMDAQVLGNLAQPIPVPSVGHRNPLSLGPPTLKQIVQRGPVCLRLPPGNVSEHPIRLMFRNERLRTQADLSFQLLPRPRP